mgnify:FL=1
MQREGFKLDGYGDAVVKVKNKITDYMYTAEKEILDYQQKEQTKGTSRHR